MDKGTLIDVVAMIDARVASLNKYIENTNEDTAHAQVFELQRLSKHLQVAIDADIAAMESSTGE
jgi:hypothetical protein